MNPRIEKKVSKRLVQLAPKLFKDAWVDNEVERFPKHYEHRLNRKLTAHERKENTLANKCRVNHVLCVGGGLDYWGEGQDWYSCFKWLKLNYEWLGNFPSSPKGHQYQGYPDTGKFKPTTINLMNLVREYCDR